MRNIDQLGTIAAETAMRAAAEYIRVHGLVVRDYDVAVDCLRSYLRTRLPIALDAAKRAFDCGMDRIAEQTFLTEMRLAGIEAAKEFGWPAA